MAATETTYEITVSLKAATDWVLFGCFQLGSDKEPAMATFESLTGRQEQTPLRLELMQHGPIQNLLLGRKMCRLDDLAENVRIITRDAFKYVNLE